MAELGCQSLGLIDVGGIGSIEGDPQKYESLVDHLGLLGALRAAQGAVTLHWTAFSVSWTTYRPCTAGRDAK